MSTIPSNYTVPTAVSNMTAIDSEENKARAARVDELGRTILSEDPKISAEAKMDAINTLRSMGRASREAGAQEAVAKAYWLVTESPFAKEMDAAGARFSAEMNSAGRQMQANGDAEPNAGQLNLDALNRRSTDEQKLIAFNMGFSSLDSWKADLEAQARDYAARNPTPAVKVTLSDEAKAALADDDAKTGAEQALATLQSQTPSDVMGAAALSILESAAKAREERDAERAAFSTGASEKDRNRPYLEGDVLNKTA